MNQQFYRGVAALKELTMTSDEKDRLLSRILENNPHKRAVPSPLRFLLYFSSFSDKFSFNLNKHVSYAMAVLMILLLSGVGSVFAAEQALPGDFLYGIKTKVNEPILDALALKKESQAERESSKAGRRLEEAEALLAEGRLDEPARQSLLTRFQNNMAAFEARVKEIAGNGAEKTKSDTELLFRATLDAHARILQSIKTRVGESQKGEIEAMEKVLDKRSELKETDGSLTAAEFNKKQEELRGNIRKTRTKLNMKQVNTPAPALSQDIEASAEAVLGHASHSLKEASKKKEAGDIDGADKELRKGVKAAEEADVLRKQGEELGKHASPHSIWKD